MDWFLYDNGLRHERVKACPNTDRSFDLIKEHCMDNSVLKQFISICTDGESTSMGCNNSLFTCLIEKHLHPTFLEYCP